MKNYTQAYVKNSLEAAAMYCEAFGAEVTFAMMNAAGNAYEHCELSVNGEPILALAEAKNPCDIEVVHKNRWQTMTFNAFELGRCGAGTDARGALEPLLRHRHRPIRCLLVAGHLRGFSLYPKPGGYAILKIRILLHRKEFFL